MRKPLLNLGFIALISLAATSCKKDSAGTSVAATSEISFAVNTDNPSVTLDAVNGPVIQSTGTNALTAGVTWTSGIANIAQFKLEAKKNGVEKEVSTSNLTNVDLLAAIPAFVKANIDTGTYKEIELRILLVKSTGTDIPLTLKGTFTSKGGAVVPIEYDFNDDALIKLEAENITVDGTNNVTAGADMHLNKLLFGITSAQIDAATRTGGTIVISSTSNPALYAKIKLNVLLAFAARHFEKHHK
ncbi:hypothetical protein [Mucilaginibacter psychrotolerans]|uniref:DUF4382 domain-containing protein n=1 Tax=Mucilaginibacter psychrotolerans TaxID=1524096 RepID=A0A4Y8SDN2_9SPHI|nr:hypothetical protein [Mucilaginibacter psychrotolerans]TFF36496.1 hypothetical protein E2R66_15165 [Mucilaginibacter psychrotolerans]